MKITSSKNKSTLDKVDTIIDPGKSIASVLEVVMDKEYIESNRHDWCWLGWQNVPTETGWYQIDRNNKQLIEITADDAAKLEWHERMFVYASGHAAVKESSPLALYIGDEYPDGRISALYLCGPDYLSLIAQK